MSFKNRVLVVDDDETNITVLEDILQNEYECRCVTTGEAALEALQTFGADIILLDIMMPGISGYEVCNRIRKDKKLRFAKIILISAKAMLEERIEGYESGADDYITKPFDEMELLAKLNVFKRLKYLEEIQGYGAQLQQHELPKLRLSADCIRGFISLIQKNANLTDKEQVYLDQVVRLSEKLVESADKISLLCKNRWEPET